MKRFLFYVPQCVLEHTSHGCSQGGGRATLRIKRSEVVFQNIVQTADFNGLLVLLDELKNQPV